MKFKVGDEVIDEYGDTGKVVKLTKKGINIKWFKVNGLPNLTGSIAEYDVSDYTSASQMYQGFRILTKLERALR